MEASRETVWKGLNCHGVVMQAEKASVGSSIPGIGVVDELIGRCMSLNNRQKSHV